VRASGEERSGATAAPSTLSPPRTDPEVPTATRSRGRPRKTGAVPRVPPRDEILEAAGRLFAEQGYAGTSTAEIAEAVGLTQPAIFYYFTSKEELLRELMTEGIKEPIAELVAVLSAPASAGAKLYHLIVFHLTHHHSLPFTPTVLIEDGQRLLKRGQDKDLIKKDKQYSSGIREIIRDGVKSKEFRDVDPVMTAMAVLGMCNWSLRWYKRGGRLSPLAVGHQFAELTLSGILADPDAIEAVREEAEGLTDLR
jgi:AcrR family transcriptional regulator